MTDYRKVPNHLLLSNPVQAHMHDKLQIFSCRTIRYQLRKTGWTGKEHVFLFPDGSQQTYDAKRFTLQEAAEIIGLSSHDTLVDEAKNKKIKFI